MWRSLCLVQFVFLIGAFTFLGLTPTPEETVPMFNDKLMHCGGYFLAGLSISFAFPYWKFFQRAAFLIIYSVGIEIGQHFMPPRTFDVFDICANSTGVFLGLLLILVLAKNVRWFDRVLFWQAGSKVKDRLA
ncbi:MAG: VanZ family protein [Gammaproteobacteria bacterium]|nr:MAG: VanZ family protein [Gammaproteobacteria bacterium]